VRVIEGWNSNRDARPKKTHFPQNVTSRGALRLLAGATLRQNGTVETVGWFVELGVKTSDFVAG
jgi:hypothetical protein